MALIVWMFASMTNLVPFHAPRLMKSSVAVLGLSLSWEGHLSVQPTAFSSAEMRQSTVKMDYTVNIVPNPTRTRGYVARRMRETLLPRGGALPAARAPP